MLYTIYQITNLIDGKIYIGKHKTSNINDKYMGSGLLLQRAQRKYGLENFAKEILFIFDNEEEMNRKEAELVSESFVERNDTYNICHGGHGGWGYVNKNILTEEDRKIAGSKGGKAYAKKCAEKRRNTVKIKGPGRGSHLKGNNRQAGRIWITNEKENRKIFPNENIPEGWRKGGRIKEIRLQDIKKKDLDKRKALRNIEQNQTEEHFKNIWDDMIENNISICSASKKYNITKQRMFRVFKKLFPEEYAQKYAKGG